MIQNQNKLISKTKWFSKSSATLLSATLPFCLTGCMGVYEGAFECPPGEGVGCKSISEVNTMVDQCSGSVSQCSACKIPVFKAGESDSRESEIWYAPWYIHDHSIKFQKSKEAYGNISF